MLSKDSSHKSGQCTLPLSYVLKCNSIHEFIQQSLGVSGANSSQRNPSLLHRNLVSTPKTHCSPPPRPLGFRERTAGRSWLTVWATCPEHAFPSFTPCSSCFAQGLRLATLLSLPRASPLFSQGLCSLSLAIEVGCVEAKGGQVLRKAQENVHT